MPIKCALAEAFEAVEAMVEAAEAVAAAVDFKNVRRDVGNVMAGPP